MNELEIAQLRSKRLFISMPVEFSVGTLPQAYTQGYETAWRGWDLTGVYYSQQKHRKAFHFGREAGAAAFKASIDT